jgi:DNA (cytosine-5)-methyltransferase 1
MTSEKQIIQAKNINKLIDHQIYYQLKRNLTFVIEGLDVGDEQRKYNVLSLFSGCGGLDLGFAQLGADSLELEYVGLGKRRPRGNRFKILWANDIYPPSCQTYSANFDVEIYTESKEPYQGKARIFQGDVAKISFEDAVGEEKIHVILGGFPCQDFSIVRGADKRLGVKVKRGRLYCHFVRALATLQPYMFVAENVKGLVSANRGIAYKWILDDFQNLRMRWSEIEAEYKENSFGKEGLDRKRLEGYTILFSKVINFKNLGVPQARERLIIIGLRNDMFQKLEYPKALIRELEKNLTGDNSLFSTFPLTPIEVFEGETLGSLQDKYRKIMAEFDGDIKSVNSQRKLEYVEKVLPKYTWDIWSDYFWLNQNNKGGQDLTTWIGKEKIIEEAHRKVLLELGYYKKPLNEDIKFEDGSNIVLREKRDVVERMRHIPPGENHEFVRDTEYHVTGLMSNIYRRLHPLKPSPTIIARGGGGTWGYHYEHDRQRLTNRERARLQTFPDTFIFKGKPGEVRTQIGEAVPPLASKVIAENIVKILDKVAK